MKVIETLWFTNKHGCIGIVVAEEDVTGERKAYIGPASGTDEKADTEQILAWAWGNKFSLDVIERIHRYLTKSNVVAVAPKLLEACKAQHDAIDRLFAEVIRRDPDFFPSKSGQPWEAIQKGNAAIAEAEI